MFSFLFAKKLQFLFTSNNEEFISHFKGSPANLFSKVHFKNFV